MKKKLYAIFLSALLCVSCVFNESLDVNAKSNVEGENITFNVKGSVHANFYLTNNVAVGIVPEKTCYKIVVHNSGFDSIDSITLNARVTKDNGSYLKSSSKTLKNVKVGNTTWTWNTQKGETVQEHITVSLTGYDGGETYVGSGSTVRYNFAGGKYGTMKAYDGQKHHMPSASVDGLSDYKGAALRMLTSEHKKTASYGSSTSAKNFRKKEKKLVDEGKFLQAQKLGISDVQSKFGTKYDTALVDMVAYTIKELGYKK